MNNKNQSKTVNLRDRNLLRQRKRILSLAPDKALDEILDAPLPVTLVQSFSEEDFYFLTHDIGPEDSPPLLALASNQQWEYILDMEIWQRDRFDIQSSVRWLYLLFKSDPNRLVHWLLNEKYEFIRFFLSKTVELRIREHDQDPSDFGEGFLSFDDTMYFRFVEDPLDQELDPESGQVMRAMREEFLSSFLERLADFDYIAFQDILLESSSIIPAEYEEETYRLRNIRIAEKGFLPFDEAIGIYKPLTPHELEKQSNKFISEDAAPDFHAPVPLFPDGMLAENNLFVGALSRIDSEVVFQQLQTEFAGLCNQIIAADRKIIRDRSNLKHMVKKACGYLAIGLERLTGDAKIDLNVVAGTIRKYPLNDIFRVGYGLVLELKWKAEQWQRKSWFNAQGLPLSFWGEAWLGVLGGLLIKKPMYFDNYRTGVIYREFLSHQEVTETENILNHIMAFDMLLSLMDLNLTTLPERFLTYKGLVLTLWARSCLNLPGEPAPIDLNSFKTFFEDLWDGKSMPRKIRSENKISFLKWLSEQSLLEPREMTGQLGQTLEDLFKEIENEYGEVDAKHLDPRYVHLFLLEKPEKTKR